MEDATLTGTVFDAHAFRGQAFAQALKMLPLFRDCGFQPFGTWAIDPSGTPIAIYHAGAFGLSDGRHHANIAAIRDANPDVPVVAMCDTYNHDDIETAVGMNLRGVVPTAFAQDIVTAVFNMVLAGGQYFPFPAAKRDDRDFKVLSDGDVMSRAVERDDPQEDADGDMELTPRQSDVLMRLQQGHSNKVIARDLEIAEATVKIYVRQLLHKFRASNRTQIVVNAATLSRAS